VDPLFESTVGQPAVKKLLALALKTRQFSHAYLFEGPAGLGKETLAREFAAAILCTGEAPPCHQCKSCRQVAAGTHPEFRWILPDDPEKDTSLSVDTIRSLIKDIYLKPYEGDWKIYVIPRADIMTFQAQNALLKTLEEPPEHAVMMLTTARPDKLLPTVLSRCQRASFRPVSREAVESWLLQHYELTPIQAKQLAAYANGTPERAVKKLESESHRQMHQLFLNLTDALAEGQLSPLLEAGEFLQTDKNRTLEILALWQEWIRDLQVMALNGELDMLIHQDQVERLQLQAVLLNPAGFSRAHGLLEEAREDLLNHGNLAFVTDMILINLQDCLTPSASPGSWR
jgi:DNA polymerase III subunit delta'